MDCRLILDRGKHDFEVNGQTAIPPLELKKLDPKAALEWLESKSSSSDRATSEQIEELKRYVRALIPEENGE